MLNHHHHLYIVRCIFPIRSFSSPIRPNA
jgi:hypothetical protein